MLPTLPPVLLSDGAHPLSPDAVRHLCALLAVSKITAAHPGLAEVKAACEPRSLATFAWAILEQWQTAQHPPKHTLAMVALAVLGDDTTVLALTELFPAWATGSSGRVQTGLDVLAAIGTEISLTELHRLARKAKTEGFRRRAERCLAGIAAARGISTADLTDQIVPRLGLDPDARTTLDYGPRQFTVGFDDQFAPRITDRHGKSLARLPRPAAADDPSLAPAAHRRFTELKKDVQSVAKERIRALEEAMVMGRRWTGRDFEHHFVRHPLVWQLVHRLLWATFDNQGRVTTVFRPAEDRTFADLDDKALPLDEEATIGLAHPWHLAADLPTWATILADYQIIQPFPQLSRDLYTPATTDPTTFTGANTEARKLFMLTARGWRFNQAHDAALRDWPDNRTVELAFSPGYHWQEPDQQAKKLTEIRVWTTTLSPNGSAPPNHPDDPATFTDLNPIAASEALRDLHFLTG